MTNEEILREAIHSMDFKTGDSINIAQLENFGNAILRIRAEQEFKPKPKYDYYLAKYSLNTENDIKLSCKMVKVLRGTDPEEIWLKADSLVGIDTILYDLMPFQVKIQVI